MNRTKAVRLPVPSPAASRRDATRAAWESLRRSGVVAPELPSILFVAIASCSGFWWGLSTGVLTVIVILGVRLRRGLSGSAVVGSAIGLAIAAAIAHHTGAATSGVLADICIDAGLAALLVVSIAARRPLFAVLWSIVHRRPLLQQADDLAVRGYYLTTGIAAVALLLRSLALFVVYVEDEPVAWLLGVKIALGLPVTLIVIAAAYAAGALHGLDGIAGAEGPIH